MSSDFYTNVSVWGGKILYRGINSDGRKVRQKIDYNPTLFVPSKKPTKHTTLYGEYVDKINPGSIRECRDFVRQYDGVEGFMIYGNQNYEYAFIADQHPGTHIDWDKSHLNICNIDIEVGSDNGFPEPATANEPITAITYKRYDQFLVFGCGDFKNVREDVKYIKCRDEIDLIKKFLTEWCSDYPDIITGWNVRLFDIPYLVNRITKMCGETEAKRLSPWNVIQERKINFGPGREFQTYIFLGISALDYIDLYQRYAKDGKSQESYKLDAIAEFEGVGRKLSYEEYGSLHSLYRDNYQMFIEYNIRDVELIDKLDDKLKLIELALTLAYDSKTNYEDVFSQVRMWDALTYNHLRAMNMVIPPKVHQDKDEAYIGAYVKDPLTGRQEWVASFDLDSLYPHLIMQYNISPDMIIEPKDYTDVHRNILNQGISIESLLEERIDLSGLVNTTVTPNGQFFRTDKQGFLAEMMEQMYDDRKTYKKKMLEAQQEREFEKDPTKRADLQKKIARYNNLQLAKKVCLNSAYGALGNQYFRFFDIRQAIAVTTSGQLSIRWVADRLNRYMNDLLRTKNHDYIIASDTDSIYLSLKHLVAETIEKSNPNVTKAEIITFMDKACKTKIQPVISAIYDDLACYVKAAAQKMSMKRESLCDVGIWTAKKRYILNVWDSEGVRYAKPKIKVSGLELVKSSTPTACRKKMKESLEVIVNGTEDQMIQFIEDFKEEFKTLPVADIASPRGVNGMTKYRGHGKAIYGDKCPIHVRGSLVYNHFLDKGNLGKKYVHIKEGEKIKYIYLKEPNTIQSNIISFPTSGIPEEFGIAPYIDYNLQFSKAFLEPVKIITDSVGWKTEKVSSLMDFFS